MLADLKARRILVTGSSSGIGLAVARQMLELGAHVGVHGRRDEPSDAVQDLMASYGDRAAYFSADLAATAACEALIQGFVSRFGGLDVLVNNAGGLGGRRRLELIDDDFYAAVMDLNVRSVLMTTRFAIPHLRASAQASGQTASVINTGSIAGREGGGPGASVYAASKAWLHAVQRSWVKELTNDGIRFNAVSPGSIVTAFHADKDQAAVDRIAGSIPMGRFGTPEEVAPMYAFLASHTCSGYITGQIFDVNGGQICP